MDYNYQAGNYPTTSQINGDPAFFRNIYGGAQMPTSSGNPYLGGNQGLNLGNLFSGNINANAPAPKSNVGGTSSSSGNVTGNVTGGGSVNFGGNTPEGMNPYQWTPVFQNLQRPSSPIAGETPEEEYLRQYMMGMLLGPQQGQEASMNELMKTVTGQYLNPNTNPYLNQSINALGADTSNQLNKSVNDILSRAGVGGALGGSRAALMQGQAAGETTRGYNETVANLLNQNYQGERNRQLGAIPGLEQTEQIPVQLAQQAMGLAGIPREYQQQLINAQMGELLRQQNERLLPLQVGQSILGQRMGQTIPIAQPQQSSLAGLGQLAQGGASLFNAMGGTSGLGNMFSGLGGGLSSLFGGGSSSAGMLPLAQQALGFDPYAGLFGAGMSGLGGMGEMAGMGAGTDMLGGLTDLLMFL